MLDLGIVDKIKDLTAHFSSENAWERSEDHIQTFFTVRLLELLGWTSSHININQGQAVKTGKKPDVLLHQSGNTLLVVESKDASKKDMLDGHYQDKTFEQQLYGYCKGEGVFWGVLTNFVEWRLYSVHREVLYRNKKLAFWDLLWPTAVRSQYVDLLSEDGLAFLDGLQYASLIKVKGKWDDDPVYYPQQKEIKEKFFRDLKRWRQQLRSCIAATHKKTLSVESIDSITQQILDRLIFIDYCSDNDIITQDRLGAILFTKASLGNELARIFADMNEKFNSELFAPSPCDEIAFDENVLRTVIEEISDINFKNMSANVIGEVYESYLSELLRMGKAGIKVEEGKGLKKKKEQGIYYTPDYVVDYIVENTVGVLLQKCRYPEDLDSIRVLDPACGSGSFLIRVFDEFMKHYRRILHEPLLELNRRKQILQNNIFGVDYDERAVEIAKLNLLLKALEGGSLLPPSARKILPNLKLNIRCGNSLISGELIEDKQSNALPDRKPVFLQLCDYHLKYHSERLENEQFDLLQRIQLLEERLELRSSAILSKFVSAPGSLKPFNYAAAFPEAILANGFDCVLGNPPYIDSELMSKQQPEARDFISDHYDLAKGNWDIYIAFLERARNLTKPGGFWAFITPDKWLSKPFGDAVRSATLKNMVGLVKVGREVFADANVDSIISIFRKAQSKKLMVHEFRNGKTLLLNTITKSSVSPPFRLDFLFSRYLKIVQKLEALSASNRSRRIVCESACATSDAYALKPLIREGDAEPDLDRYFKVTNTGTIAKYEQLWGKKEMTYLGHKYLCPVVEKKQFLSTFGSAYTDRAKHPKLIVKGLTLLDACLDLNGNTIPGKSTLVVLSDDPGELKFLAAVINCSISMFLISQKYPSSSYNQGITFTKDMLNCLPIPAVTNAVQSIVIDCVDQILGLVQKKRSATNQQGDKIDLQCRSKQREIEEIMFSVYGLEDQEIQAIEKSVK